MKGTHPVHPPAEPGAAIGGEHCPLRRSVASARGCAVIPSGHLPPARVFHGRLCACRAGGPCPSQLSLSHPNATLQDPACPREGSEQPRRQGPGEEQ